MREFNFNKLTTCHEKIWVTADGETKPFSQISQQHWSNIYWYHKVFKNIPGMPYWDLDRKVQLAVKELQKSFPGSMKEQILSWKPVFDYELNWLKKLDMLRANEIWYFGEKIGQVDYSIIKHVPGIKLFD